MSIEEIKQREAAMFKWLQNPKNATNPNRSGVSRYWLRLENLILAQWQM